MHDYFSILNLEKDFNIDLVTLKNAYRKIIAKNHPDRAKSPIEKQQFINITSLINKAYHCLKDDSLRAEHLLNLNDIDLNSSEYANKISSIELAEFLDEFESINEAQSEEFLKKKLEEKLSSKSKLISDIGLAFKNNYIQQALAGTLKLRYIQRIITNIEKQITNGSYKNQ